ncbi:hypothetical protein BCF58_1982 [Chryseobacterium defluvii]|uniref:Uncharacterized protein n=1 Tax=Chryseobacterium defluvii TaxID=160396 RepID=A0A495SE11_9FLAO|nr:hypothetical protein BCF58_1982 [Chryseobacterium defluvii]
MKNLAFKTFLFLNGLILLQNIQFLCTYLFEFDILAFLPNLISHYFFFITYFLGIIMFFWTLFYIKKLKWLIVLFLINITIEYFVVFYVIGDSF